MKPQIEMVRLLLKRAKKLLSTPIPDTESSIEDALRQLEDVSRESELIFYQSKPSDEHAALGKTIIELDIRRNRLEEIQEAIWMRNNPIEARRRLVIAQSLLSKPIQTIDDANILKPLLPTPYIMTSSDPANNSWPTDNFANNNVANNSTNDHNTTQAPCIDTMDEENVMTSSVGVVMVDPNNNVAFNEVDDYTAIPNVATVATVFNNGGATIPSDDATTIPYEHNEEQNKNGATDKSEDLQSQAKLNCEYRTNSSCLTTPDANNAPPDFGLFSSTNVSGPEPGDPSPAAAANQIIDSDEDITNYATAKSSDMNYSKQQPQQSFHRHIVFDNDTKNSIGHRHTHDMQPNIIVVVALFFLQMRDAVRPDQAADACNNSLVATATTCRLSFDNSGNAKSKSIYSKTKLAEMRHVLNHVDFWKPTLPKLGIG